MRKKVLFILKNTFFMALLFAGSAIASSKPHHVVVMDAGSSGTRMYLWKVTDPVTPQTMRKVEPMLTNLEFDKMEDGIDDFVCTPGIPPANVNKVVIGPLLDELEAYHLPAGVKKTEITVNVLATAGMRTAAVNCTEKEVNHLYSLIKKFIKSRHYILGEVRTTDGNKEEGVWTWLNLNYVKDKLKPGDTPYGDLEVGGSSSQLVFPTIRTQADPAKNIYAVAFNGKTHYVFSKSYLGLGQDDARKYIRTTANPEVCWAKGFLKANDYGEPGLTSKLLFDGDYNYASCTSLYDAYLAQKITENNGAPPIDLSVSPFIGLDGAYYAASYFDPSPSDDPSLMTTEIPPRCADVYLNPGIQDPGNKAVQRQCPNGTFVNSMMFGTSGLFTMGSNKVTLTIPNDVNKVRVFSWTRGYLLLKK